MPFLKKLVAFLAKFIAGYGSPLVFAAILWSAFKGISFLGVSANWFSTGIPQYDLMIVVITSLVYLWLQGIAAAWGDVGSDSQAMADLIFSFIPAGVLGIYIYDGLWRWEYVTVIGAIVAYDIFVNTKILFKVARLTSELAKAGR